MVLNARNLQSLKKGWRVRLKSGRQLNEVDTIFYSHSRLADGLYRFAGSFECAADTGSEERVRSALAEVMERYPAVFLVDPAGDRSPRVDTRFFTSERELRNFYVTCLSEPYSFGNALVHAWLIDKPDGSRSLFLLIPHFAGDSKIAAFVLGRVLGPQNGKAPPEELVFVSYRDLWRQHVHSARNVFRSLWCEVGEMARSFAFTSPRKGRMDIATVFLDEGELKALNAARRGLALSRSLLLQVAALHAYRLVAPPQLARVFNVIYDNTPELPTVNNCFRSMPLVFPRRAGRSTLEQSRELFNRLTERYAQPWNRYAFLLRSVLVSSLPLALVRWIFPRSTRGVQHYISYVFLDGKLHVDSAFSGALKVTANIEPVGYALSNFNVVEFNKQVALNVTWDTASLGATFGDDLLRVLRGLFSSRDPIGKEAK